MRQALALLLLLAALPASLAAQDRVESALEELDRALANETSLASPTRDALRGVVEALREERRNAPAGGSSVLEPLEALQAEIAAAPSLARYKAERGFPRLRFSGDFRYRFEASVDQDDRPDRYRQRVRFRFNSEFAINDEVTVNARLVTGDPDDPNSPHQTLGSVFDKFPVSLDRVNVVYRPTWAPGLSATLGKFGHDFRSNPVYGELVWDADVQAEGARIDYVWKGDGAIERLEFRAGLYVVLESGGGDDAFAFVGQAAGVFALAEDLHLAAAASYYHWTDTTPDGALGALADNAGNVTVDRDLDGTIDDYASDFGILDAFLALTYDGWSIPVTVSGEVIWNHRAANDRDLGWSAGLALGRDKAKGDWKFFYAYSSIEQDAVFSPVAQDDFLLQTNHQSHVVGVNYMLDDSVGLRLWALISARDTLGTTATTDSDDDQFRIRLDLNISF
ncbi:MAG: putative porin [Planctomycetota bacterium]